MFHLIDFFLVHEVKTQDSTGQTSSARTLRARLGQQKSVYQAEFFKAEEAGIRPQGIIVMNSFDYGGEDELQIGTTRYSIYRTYEVGTDKIELYYGERVGTKHGLSTTSGQ